MKKFVRLLHICVTIIVLLILGLMIILAHRIKVNASCVAMELQNCTKDITIMGEIKIPQIEQSIKEAIKEAIDKSSIELLAEVMFHENWYTDEEHLAAYYTGAVVMNRVKSESWPDTVKDVLYQVNQYSTTHKFFTKKIPQECYKMALSIIENGTPDVPSNVIFQAQFKQGSGVWKKVKTDYFCYE